MLPLLSTTMFLFVVELRLTVFYFMAVSILCLFGITGRSIDSSNKDFSTQTEYSE